MGLVSTVQPVKADYAWAETVYIRADGSVEPNTAPVSTVDNITYTLTDNIVGYVPEYTNAITIERDNIAVNGANYTIQREGGVGSTGIFLSERSNITVKNMKFMEFYYGIKFFKSFDINISRNTLISNHYGIYLEFNGDNNLIYNNSNYGLYLSSSAAIVSFKAEM